MASFGSAETYRTLKGMQGSTDETMVFLYPLIQQQCNQIARTGHRFPKGNYVTFANTEVEEYYNEAIIYLFSARKNEEETRLNVFLNNPQYDPDGTKDSASNNDLARQGWFRNILAGAMANVKKRRASYATSLDDPLTGEGDEEADTLLDILPDLHQTAEERMSGASPLIHALTEIFSLKNRTDILMTVVYVILRNELFPGDKYVDFVAEMNDRTVGDLAEELDSVFAEGGIQTSVTEVIRLSGREKDLSNRITGLTTGKIANNKNDIQNALKKRTSLDKLQSENLTE